MADTITTDERTISIDGAEGELALSSLPTGARDIMGKVYTAEGTLFQVYASDSGNNAGFDMTRDGAVALRDWLNEQLAKHPH